MQYFEYENRTKLCSGAHALEHLPYECALRGAKKPLLLTDPNRERKLEFVTSALCPQAAFLDPRMTEALPLRITASTGMDALCHALEAFTCRQKNPISDGVAIAALAAIEAIRKLRALLHDAAGLPSHLEETGRVKHADLDAVSRKAIQDGALLYNPRPMSREPVLQILQKAW